MDFKKILANFDAVENDTTVAATERKASAGSMLAILESFNRVENEVVEETAEEDLDVETAEEVEESVDETEEVAAEEVEESVDETEEVAAEEELEEAIMVSADGDEAAQLLSILQLAGMSAPAPAPMEPEMGPMEPEMEMQDEYSNSPNEFEQDVDAVIASGDDLHREKNQYAATADGDNPMKAFEGKFKAIMDELLAEDEK